MPSIEIFEASRQSTAASTASPRDLYARQQFEAGLQWLQSRGVHVERHSISLDGSLAVENSTVRTAIELQGEDSLPLVVLNGTIISIGGHPTRSDLLVSAGYKTSDDPGFLQELSSLATNMGAALTSNNTTTLLFHCEQVLSLGVPAEDLRQIIESEKTANRQTIRDDTLTKVEQFLALGSAGRPKVPPCSCGVKPG